MALKIIRHTQDTIISYMPFLNRAIVAMPAEFIEDDPGSDIQIEDMGTDGRVIYAGAEKLISYFKALPAKLPRMYMHMIFHCMFFHPFQYDKMDFEIWDFAADAAVENTMLMLNWKNMDLPKDTERRRILANLGTKIKRLTAENIYNYYRRNPAEWKKDKVYAGCFTEDDHGMWVSIFHFLGEQLYSDRADLGNSGGNVLDSWKEIGKTIQLNAESSARYREMLPGSAIDNIKAVYKEKYDYGKFLKNFISNHEEMKINQDEFDYIYYTYGMKLYKNLPLIEPLEYKEDSRIRDLVIAIDTSGSCQGHIVKSFLNKTYTMVSESGSFFEHMNLHIIQCDSEIKNEVKITGREDFERYIREVEVKGFGGTDFRPVFERVNKLLREKEFSDFRGLIYLTDGLGIYPKAAPEYRTAFVIIEDANEKPKVPAWAISLVMEPDDLS